MHTSPVRRPALPVLLCITLLSAFLLFLAPQRADAHDSLLGTNPAADSTVDVLPAELTLTFSAAIESGKGATQIIVEGPNGSVTAGDPSVNGAVVTQPLIAEGMAGDYTVIWRVVYSDGHDDEKQFAFSVATDSPSAAESTPPSDAATAPSPAQSAEPTTESSSAQETPAPTDETRTEIPLWIWIVGAVVGVGVIALVLFALLAGRGKDTESDIEAPTER